MQKLIQQRASRNPCIQSIPQPVVPQSAQDIYLPKPSERDCLLASSRSSIHFILHVGIVQRMKAAVFLAGSRRSPFLTHSPFLSYEYIQNRPVER